jgi:hypothetical protein
MGVYKKLFLYVFLMTAWVCLQPVWCRGANSVATVSRSVKIFSENEAALNEAVLKSDKDSLNTLITDDFEERNGSAPGRAIPRADWIAGIAKAEIGEISQMAVHDYGQIAVVSFMLSPAAKPSASRHLVVDVWRKSEEAWVLATRFISAAK